MLVQHHRQSSGGHRLETFLFLRLDQQIVFGNLRLRAVDHERHGILRPQLPFRLRGIQLPDRADHDALLLLREIPPDRGKIRFDGNAREFAHVIPELKALHIQLVQDDRLIVRGHLIGRLDVHPADRLTVLDTAAVPDRTPEDHDVEDMLHPLLEITVDPALIRHRIIAEMDALLRVLLDSADQVLVDLLRHERDHRRGEKNRRLQAGVKRLIGVDLVLLHAVSPEAAAAAADIPVGKIIHKILQRLAGFGRPVGRHVFVNGPDRRVEPGEDPAVHHAQRRVVRLVLRRVELINVRVQHVERIGVPQRAEELSLSLLHGLAVEPARKPGGRAGEEIPSDRVRSIFAERVHRVDGISLRLRHLLSVLVLNKAHDDAVLERRLIKEQRRNRMQRVEPSAGLVHRLGDEARRELLFEQLLILKRIVKLGEGH